MTFNDEQFGELVKKAKRKRNGWVALISVLTVFILVFLGIGSYLFYMNYGPFQGNMISGVPDGYIKILNERTGPLSLIFNSYGGYAFNTQGKKVNVYLDYYEKDVIKKHELVVGFHLSEKSDINGTLYWGATAKGETGQPEELRVNILTTNGASSKRAYDLNQLLNNEDEYSYITDAFSNGKIENGRRYVLQRWSVGGTFPTGDNFFDKEILRKSPQTVILYLVFE